MGALIDGVYAAALEQERERGRIVWPSSKYASDPVGFCEDILGFAPTNGQIEILTAAVTHRRVAVRSGRRIGKSRAAAALALWAFTKDVDATVILLAPTERQIVEIVWHDIQSLFHNSGRCVTCRMRDPEGPRPCPHGACIDGELSASVRTGLRAGERRLFGMAPRSAEHVRGIAGRNQTYIFDEGSGIADDVHEQCDGNTAGGGSMIAFGQPSNPVGWFARTFRDKGSRWHPIHISSLTSPNVVMRRTVVPSLADLDFVERKLEQYGAEHATYQCEILGEFPTNQSRLLISEAELAGAFDRHAGMAKGGDPFVFGVDLAGGSVGGDASTYVWRRGWRMSEVVSMQAGPDRMLAEIATVIAKERKHPREIVTIQFDGEGIFGQAFEGALRELRRHDECIRATPLMSRGDKLSDMFLRRTGCARLRDAYWWVMAARLKTVVGIPFNERLREALLFTQWDEDRTYGDRLPEKREYRRGLGRSPDEGDAVAYCLHDGEIPMLSDAQAQYARAMHEPAPEAPEPRAPDPYYQSPFVEMPGYTDDLNDSWWR